jgi:AraC family transcriptional regulator
MPPRDWLRQQQIERSKQMLLARPDSQAVVAAACGFCDQVQFLVAFREVTGVTPGTWRRSALFSRHPQ